jgi:DNA repair exonuclease SbcCD ATPase subunit
MGTQSKILAALAIAASVLAASAYAQDSDAPSLGDVARQQRQHEQTKDAKPKVITNADIPAHSDDQPDTISEIGGPDKAPLPVPSSGPRPSSEHLRSQIQQEKSRVAELQRQIDEINQSIRFAPANCVRGCVQWNQRQEQKQQQVERLQAQLEEQKQHLQELQESARKQGFGSSVFDP